MKERVFTNSLVAFLITTTVQQNITGVHGICSDVRVIYNRVADGCPNCAFHLMIYCVRRAHALEIELTVSVQTLQCTCGLCGVCIRTGAQV